MFNWLICVFNFIFDQFTCVVFGATEMESGDQKLESESKRDRKKEPAKPLMPEHVKRYAIEEVCTIDWSLWRPLSHTFLGEKFADYLCSHNLQDCLEILFVFADEKGMDEIVLMRGSMIVAETLINSGSITIDHNLTSILLMFFSADCLKAEVLLELMSLYFTNNQFEAAQEDLTVRSSLILNRGHTNHDQVVLEYLSSAYFAILDFIFWRKGAYDTSSSSWRDNDEALEMLASQITMRMKTVLNSGPGPFDLIIPPLLDLLFFKKDIEGARQCLVTYKQKNPTNLNAYIYLYKFIGENLFIESSVLRE